MTTPAHTAPTPDVAGFTVLEVVVATALLGVVTGLAISMFSVVGTRWTETRTLQEMEAQVAGAFDAMARDFNDILPVRLAGGALQGHGAEAADPLFHKARLDDDNIVFSVGGAAAADAESAARVRYAVDRTETRPRLVRYIGPSGAHIPDRGRLELAPRLVVTQLDFEYAGENGQWRQEWLQEGLPQAIRVSMTAEDPDRSYIEIARKRVFPIRVR